MRKEIEKEEDTTVGPPACNVCILLGISKDGEEHFEDIYIYIFKRLSIREGEGGEGWSNSVTENSVYVAIRLDQL